ncbi:hypothetical protein FZC79_15555 [Rossellomorea vietnamensis]|uniref:Uncharacterized protein n=2 Tax=Rossellomorea TaxID=2837508 RepID=A0A5D4KA40_9BACI|nr:MULTISPECIES: hypothetical protein [Rossellomorea]TYR74227.1 hypothetical protein FZC79_15555 [Rossellomorea vietnamensis]TYS79752.1 hypothetical protein FZC80_08905 [Rossellomorea aquimaris]
MNRMAKNLIMGSLVSAGSAALATAMYKKRKKNNFSVYPDTDMRDSIKIDVQESVNADMEDAEKGLTKLDSAYRSEWQANGFPQTHAEMERLEAESRQER